MKNSVRITNKTIVALYFIVFLIIFVSYVSAAPPSFREVDMVEFHSKGLMSLGVEDLSYNNLVEVLSKTENAAVKFHIIYLFGEKGLKESIPIIIPFLNDKDINIRIAAANALSMLGDMQGVPVLEKICEENPADLKCLDAAGALAEKSNLKAYVYLKKFIKSNNEGLRSGALNHMKTLAEKIEKTNPEQSMAILDDMITVLSEDEDASVKEHAIWLLGGIKVNNKKHVIERLNELKVKFKTKAINTKILQQIDSVIEHLELKEKQKLEENHR
ncbi:MAG: HEAT repeat domain-containing protein [Thermodesulfovibrionales bacterium]